MHRQERRHERDFRSLYRIFGRKPEAKKKDFLVIQRAGSALESNVPDESIVIRLEHGIIGEMGRQHS